ncbi:MAG: DUF4384 domain-containing protein [Candidatus Marinimicrobia bacterium]|nr:DUF4384 domain-containing protein [Candidatus Neomarinimicrobiota bacterium]
MRWLLLSGLSILMIGGCSSLSKDAGPEGEPADRARIAAEGAFRELEGGGEEPLPGMSPGPAELGLLDEGDDLDTDAAAEAARAAAKRLAYEVRPGWFMVDTSLVFPNSVSPEKARQAALMAARAAGLEQALPQEISFTSLLSDIMDETAGAAFEKSTWSTFALSSVTGHLIDEKILSTGLEPMKGNAYRYRIVLEARVVPVKGERDPSLRLELEVNERLLAAGDELVIKTRPSQDGYLYVFNFLSDNTVMLMFPNAYMTDHAVAAGTWLEIPTRQERDRGIHYRVAAAPGVPTANETIYAVFTRQPIADLSALIDMQEGYATFTAGDESFTTFQRWLWQIPLGQRVEKAVQIHIVNDKE